MLCFHPPLILSGDCGATVLLYSSGYLEIHSLRRMCSQRVLLVCEFTSHLLVLAQSWTHYEVACPGQI